MREQQIIITNVCVSVSRSSPVVDSCDNPNCCQGISYATDCVPKGQGGTLGDPGMTNCCQVIAAFPNENCCEGCTDPYAPNYDSCATCDNGSCVTCVYGCTDDGHQGQAWWEAAQTNLPWGYDDLYGLDIYPGDGAQLASGTIVNNRATSGWYGPGGANAGATNYNPAATCDDGSCTYPSVTGCILDNAGNNPDTNGFCQPGNNPETCISLGCCGQGGGYYHTNYNSFATVSSGCITPPPTAGCMDPYACNFLSLNTVDCNNTAQNPDYSLGPTSDNGGTNTTFGDTSCCEYNDADPQLNPLGNGINANKYRWSNWFANNYSFYQYDDAEVVFDTSNRTVTITDLGTRDGNPSVGGTPNPWQSFPVTGGTYYWRCCLGSGTISGWNGNFNGGLLEILRVTGSGGSNFGGQYVYNVPEYDGPTTLGNWQNTLVLPPWDSRWLTFEMVPNYFNLGNYNNATTLSNFGVKQWYDPVCTPSSCSLPGIAAWGNEIKYI